MLSVFLLIIHSVVFSLFVYRLCCLEFLFFLKQKTAYELRISDWSSDVCSSDLYCFTAKPGSVIGGLRMRTFSVLSNPVSREGAVRMSSDCSARCALNRKLSAMTVIFCGPTILRSSFSTSSCMWPRCRPSTRICRAALHLFSVRRPLGRLVRGTTPTYSFGKRVCSTTHA